ncbi:helix-turn-helix domain-containing protein [Bacillus sp. FSL M7-0417]|uniref:helix-turn-helix domain-containing protein n=1 Tax=Bacillus sp. FSL M7-0417 TaxID=2921532 RepID=UPI002E1D7300|nr:helix-turn-helix transcriptional regulator [Bacillus subtilis]
MYHFDGKKIQEAMEHIGLNMSELAALCGVSRAYINQMIKGVDRVSPAMQKRLNIVFAQFLDKEQHLKSIEALEQILEGKDESK